MKKQSILSIIAVFILAIFVSSCGKETKFTIEGNVSGAKDKTIYFEHVGVSKVSILDSVKLTDNGKFKFKQESSKEPDFYRLRLNGQLINIAIDSTETIKIQADAPRFAQNYTIEGSAECTKIKELTLAQLKASIAFNELQKSYEKKEISPDQYTEQINAIINEYKDVAKKYIFENPKSTSAYFALFQQINNLLIFDPYNKEDYKVFGAVATSWTQFYPEAIRSKHIYSLAIQALKVIRGERPMEYNVTQEIDHFEISLPDIHAKNISLNDICKNKVTLIDFTAYQMEDSPQHNSRLNIVYEKYKSQGFEIYQISLDSDQHFWKNAASNLPWICVRDPQTIYSKVASSYNVKNIPTAFILNRAGEIVKRIESYDDLDKSIAPYFK